jgi:hypothetical protein
LLTEEGTLLERTEAFADQPSALQALRDGDHVDVYLSLQESAVPVFISLPIPVLTELPASPAVAQATSIAGGELVLVATLLTGGLTEGTQQDAIAATEGEASFVLFLPPVKVSVTGAGPGQVALEDVAVALVVRADPDGLPPTEEFKARVLDALAERLATREVFDSVEDLVEAVKQVLDQFRAKPKDDEPAVFDGDLGFVTLDRVAEAFVSPQNPAAVPPDHTRSPWAPGDDGSPWCLPSAFLASWLCRPADLGRRRGGRFVSRWVSHE